jgi:hypothetical protein
MVKCMLGKQPLLSKLHYRATLGNSPNEMDQQKLCGTCHAQLEFLSTTVRWNPSHQTQHRSGMVTYDHTSITNIKHTIRWIAKCAELHVKQSASAHAFPLRPMVISMKYLPLRCTHLTSITNSSIKFMRTTAVPQNPSWVHGIMDPTTLHYTRSFLKCTMV